VSQIDLNAPPSGHKYTVSVTPEESSGDARMRYFREIVLILIAVALVGVVGYICATTVFSETATPQERAWAQSTLAGAMGAVIGYLLKK
jgi:hypothetical protein